MKDKTTVIVPTFNEELNIREVLRPLAQWKLIDPANHHVVIVNDGSTDRTKRIIDEFNKQFQKPLIEMVWSDPSTKQNRGKGEAFIVGAFRARAHKSNTLVTIDADTEGLMTEDINSLVNELNLSKKNMAIATCVECHHALEENLAGTRAIRLEALEPLFGGKPKWVELIKGFALERALNYLIPKRFLAKTTFNQATAFRNFTSDKQGREFNEFGRKTGERKEAARDIARVLGLRTVQDKIWLKRRDNQRRISKAELDRAKLLRQQQRAKPHLR